MGTVSVLTVKMDWVLGDSRNILSWVWGLGIISFWKKFCGAKSGRFLEPAFEC